MKIPHYNIVKRRISIQNSTETHTNKKVHIAYLYRTLKGILLLPMYYASNVVDDLKPPRNHLTMERVEGDKENMGTLKLYKSKPPRPYVLMGLWVNFLLSNCLITDSKITNVLTLLIVLYVEIW